MRHSTQIHSDAILATTPDHLLLTSLRAVFSTPQGSNPKATPATYILPVSELARYRTAESDHSTPPKRRLDFTVTNGTYPIIATLYLAHHLVTIVTFEGG